MFGGVASAPALRTPLAEVSTDGENVVARLQQLLASSGGGRTIKFEHVQLAHRLARDPALVPGTVCKDAGIRSGGTITRITQYRDRRRADVDQIFRVWMTVPRAAAVDHCMAEQTDKVGQRR